MLMRYLISISYDGSKFYGFQRLNDLPTVQKELEDALTVINKSMTGEDLLIDNGEKLNFNFIW